MEWKILLPAEIRRQKKNISGIFLLLFLVSLCITSALTALLNSRKYIRSEMQRLGYGDIAIWVSKVPDTAKLKEEIENLPGTRKTVFQPVLYADYQLNGIRSDDDGQLLAYTPDTYPYHFLNEKLNGYQNVETIARGEIYLSPAMQSKYHASVGDKVSFILSRNGIQETYTVAGFFEDPFMGSSMIDMKSFLISKDDFDAAQKTILKTSSFNVLEREGVIIHIFNDEGNAASVREYTNAINTKTSAGKYTEFVHSKNAIYGFMILLQNVFTGFMGAFACILFLASMIVIGHCLSVTIEQERKDMGILKAIGFTGWKLRKMEILLYSAVTLLPMFLGVFSTRFLMTVARRLTVTSTGLLIPYTLPVPECLLVFALMELLLVLFIYGRTAKIMRIPPIDVITGAIREKARGKRNGNGRETGIAQGHYLNFFLALRQICTGKLRYSGIVLIALLLSFFISAVLRMDHWLGPNGEGLMDSFSVADHDLGVQPMNNIDLSSIEKIITAHSPVRETYEIAMQSGNVNGVDYTVNVMDQPEYFHIFSGHSCFKDDEIIITETVARDLEIKVGDSVTVSEKGKNAVYTVSGIYECANQMGGNIGMSRDGYAKVGDVNAYIWCHHYILEDRTAVETIVKEIQERFRAEVSVHTNSWSGLSGIVRTLHLFIWFMYIVSAVFIILAAGLTGRGFLKEEQSDMAIYKSLGFTSQWLQLSFAVRYSIAAFPGALVGAILAAVFADPIITLLLKNFGIAVFHSGNALYVLILPTLGVIALFFESAVFVSRKIRKTNLISLITD